MKIGIILSDGGYGRFGDEKYNKIKEYGYSCVDYNMPDTTKGLYKMTDSEAFAVLDHEKRLADAAGIEFSQVHGPWTIPRPDETEEGRKQRFLECQKSIRFTSRLGCKNWVIHPIFPCGKDLGTEFEQKTRDMNIEFYSKLLKTAEEEDVTICYENLPFMDFSISTPTAVLKIAKVINNKRFKICLDTGHVTAFKDLSAGNAVRELGDMLQALHVHDTIPGYDLHMMPYSGVVDWDDFAAALKEINFKGVFSLETIPSTKLPLPLFEEMSTTLAKIAKEITKDL